MNYTVKDGQTLADIAIEVFGSWEAMIEIGRLNGISMTEPPEAGTELVMPDAQWNRMMENWCKSNEVSPATARGGNRLRLGVFTEVFTKEFR